MQYLYYKALFIIIIIDSNFYVNMNWLIALLQSFVTVSQNFTIVTALLVIICFSTALTKTDQRKINSIHGTMQNYHHLICI